LSWILWVTWDVDWSELTVTVVDPNALPIARRISREALAAARLASPDRPRPPEVVYPLERRYAEGAVLDYNLLVPSHDGFGGGAYQVGGGLDVLGGSLQALVQSEGEIRGGRTRVDASWNGVWRQNRYVTQLRLGDGISTGPRFRTLRGIAVSNAPWLRPAILGDLPYGGVLGPGWQIEAYRGGRLIAFDSVNALGQFTIDVPLQYGENPVDFVAYGPFGEVRQFNRTYRVSPEVVPPGKLEYGVSAGECRVDLCRATGNLDVRYGASRRWTLQAGLEQFWRSGRPDLFHPYVGATGSLGNAVGLHAELVSDAVIRGAVRFEPTSDLQLSTEVTRFARGVEEPILTPSGRRHQVTLTGFYRPFSRFGSLFLDGVYDRVRSDLGSLTTARLGASIQLDVLRLLPSVRLERDHPTGSPVLHRTTLVLNSILLPIRSLGPALGEVAARSTIETSSRLELEAASVYASRRLGRWLRLELGTAWPRGQRGATVSALLAAELPSLRSFSTLLVPPRGSTTSSHYVQGSMIYDRGHRTMAFAHGPSLQRGGLSGQVFLDLNDDGVREADEPTVSGVRLQIGLGATVTNQKGDFRIWDVTPYEPTYVAVDTTSLPTPLWIPAYGAMLVEPNPNRFRVLDVPILPGGVVEGRVVFEGVSGSRPLPAAPLVLEHLRTGKEVRITTFGDGTFYAMGVRPGDYELRLDRSPGESATVTAAPVRFSVPADPDGATVAGLVLTVRSRLSPAVAGRAGSRRRRLRASARCPAPSNAPHPRDTRRTFARPSHPGLATAPPSPRPEAPGSARRSIRPPARLRRGARWSGSPRGRRGCGSPPSPSGPPSSRPPAARRCSGCRPGRRRRGCCWPSRRTSPRLPPAAASARARGGPARAARARPGPRRNSRARSPAATAPRPGSHRTSAPIRRAVPGCRTARAGRRCTRRGEAVSPEA
ncbi:MAG TPA: hypothetical protein VFN96_08940, partial [Gemmatimonadales bacterium]|nr:hypothetical protein [Gemmatimonadales bacterium]